MKNGYHNIVAINFVYSFITAAIATLLPLYMLEKGFPLESIGLVMAAMPITFLVFRLIFSTLGDAIGTRTIFVFNAITNVLGICVYWAASAPWMFASGRLMDGIKASTFWAVNRTEMYKQSKNEKVADNAIRMVGVRGVADALGRFAIGLLALYISFQNMLVALCFFSFVMFQLAFDTERRVQSAHRSVKQLWSEMMKKLFKPRKKEFWLASLPLMVFGSIDYAIFVFILPVFLNLTLGLGYLEVGALIGWVSLVYSLGVFADSKFKLSLRRSLALCFVLSSFALILMPLAPIIYITPLLTIFAFGWGLGNSSFEKIVVWVTGASKDASTEIGVVHAPQRIMEFFLLSVIGFITATYGFVVVSIICLAYVTAYLVLGFNVAKMKDKEIFLKW